MKKLFMLAASVMLFVGVALACGDKKDCKGDKKDCCKKEAKKDTKDKACCKKDAKAEKTAEKKS